ncbi:VOC family protein [Rhodococcus rhodnii]|uniref:Dioxygenase n=2 Tax=Rhodococcus rhodnii TaxID=38312 RepID=R7WP04_9NOCA|nr:VOC family protein [Rhodococcus rhodnii]EOM77043.1 dioxygenase [Rhodococcus rhodnii LMG 5362]TXG89888.1 VOC family protein [Rhodococcus rhodnii]
MAASPFQGLAQVNIFANDVAAARDWYADRLGIPAYFQRPDDANPAYVEFRVGDHLFELGIVHSAYQPEGASRQAGGAVARWHVDDIVATVRALIDAGAAPYEPVIERGEGFVTASVIDPFGNVLGLIHSPHYIERLGAAGAGSTPGD